MAFDNVNKSNNVYFILMILAVTFIIIPLIGNLLQLHLEISKWTNDSILNHTHASYWIKSKVKVLFLISVVCGSSFSAVALCNSYQFQLSAFSMGLSRYHSSIFQNKRFFSIVLLEVKSNLSV